MRDLNLRVIYDEIAEMHRFQQDSVNLLYNKLNWILVSDIVFLAAVYGAHHHSILAILCASISAIIVLVKFQAQVFKSTALITDQLAAVGEPNFLESLISKKKDAFNANTDRIKNTEQALRNARYLLIAAVVLEFLTVIFIHGR